VERGDRPTQGTLELRLFKIYERGSWDDLVTTCFGK
jgi:hypothetical protein